MSCKNRGPIGITRSQRLWNDPKTAVDEYLLGFALTHPGTIVLEGHRAILRRDHAEMPGQVKLISGGGAGNEPTHTGFVGPGMLTGVVVGDIFSAPPSKSILKVIQQLGTNHSPGVLIIIQNYTGYRINFGLAKSRAQNEGIIVSMLTVGDDTCLKSFEKTAGRRGLAATLFIHKIAGAMAEEGRKLGEIWAVCNRIITSGELATIGICTRIPPSAGICACTGNSSTEQMEIGAFGFGIHGEPGATRVDFTTAKDIVCQLIDIMTDITAEASLKFAEPDDSKIAENKVAVIINNLGGSSQIELGVFTMEVIQQLTSRGLCVERIYVGTLMTSLDTSGFQLSVLKLSSDTRLIKYLDAPTAVPAWPKVLDWSGLSTNAEVMKLGRGSKISRLSVVSGGDIPEIEACGPVLDEHTAQVFLMILTFACEALTSCSKQLNIMDEDSGDGDCGTSVAQGTSAIKAAIKEKQISGYRPFVTLRQISYIIERVMGGIMGGLYSLFFDAGAKEFAKRSQREPVDACMWLNALAAGNKAVAEYGQATAGDRTMLDPLLAAQDNLVQALTLNLHPIRAFENAVKAAESKAIETIKMPAAVGRASLVKCKISCRRIAASDPFTERKMNAVIALCTFCEMHGPQVVFTTQTYRNCFDNESTEKLKFYGPKDVLKKADSLQGKAQSEGCEGCKSLGNIKYLSNEHETRTSFLSAQCPLTQEIGSLLKDACIRSLSCEVHSGKEGICYFGDDHRGHVLSQTFTLKDAQTRGFRRWYSFIVFMRDKQFLLNMWPFLVDNLREVIRELQDISEKKYNTEEAECPQRAARLKTASSGSEANSNKQPRSLGDITNEKHVFARIHMWLVWILSAGARHFVEILPMNLLDDELSYDLEHHIEVDEGFTLVNAKSPIIPKLTLEETKVAPEFLDVSYKSPITILKEIKCILGKEHFRQVLYASLTGIQVLVRGSKLEVLELLYGLSYLVPVACRRVVTQATEYMNPNACNFIGVDTSVAVPLLSSEICRLDIIPKEHKMANENSYLIRWAGTLPAKLPTLLVKIEKAFDNEKLGEPVLKAHFVALQEEWANIAKVVHAMRGRGHRGDLSGLMVSLGAGPRDQKLLDAWSMGLPSNPA
ncbi:uncharacterized protein LOC124185547 [Neodiprion fabricii]|uniref:uncharacterized protein LOC124185547 n=1 Tax=Neodiprion fabricii TaxID=2872261 RepID=UPI001ED8FD86|nr:uncharacterized protein LOC124185547 [Neodiprion fabricii]